MSTIQFCEKCDNMYYLRINKIDNDNLEYYCRYCENIKNELINGVCVLNTNFSSKQPILISNYINEYTKLDPRLPHISNIPCPNDNCDSNKLKDVETDIIYKRYNDADMKYIYICNICDYVWSTNEIIS